jgi:molybdopterin-guanine dinucleotide biosynthesis protein
MKTEINQKRVISTRIRMDEIAIEMKSQFIGLDHIIDAVMPLVTAWYTFPDAQVRPCIINLWGLTGSGKTALVKKLVAMLRRENMFAHLDMGEFESNSASSIRDVFAKNLKHFDNKQAIICLDEFQLARTIEDDYEMNKEKLRPIWEILDSGVVTYFDDSNATRKKAKQLDLSKSLIFVIGNLDEAYKMYSELDADADADYMYEQTTKITVAQIKNALKKRFRSEQIARLGNNHFLYRAFNVAQFKELIKIELEKVVRFAKKRFRLTVTFDASVTEIIYAEGVVPSQGVRPLLTTINNLVQSRLPGIAWMSAACRRKVVAVEWSFLGNEFTYDLKDVSGNSVAAKSETIVLATESQRKSIAPNYQAHTAVHESGHAVLAALMLRIVPSLVVSRTASFDSEGFCRCRFPERNMTRESLVKDIVITLGGLAAEKLVFGEEFTGSGVVSDLAYASRLANDAIRRYGMGKEAIRLSAIRTGWTEDYFVNSDDYENESLEIVRACMKRATHVLERNKLLLLKMSQYLTYNSKMDLKMIEEYVIKYSVEDWVRTSGFIEPENYYRFDEIILSQLKELELAETTVEDLVRETLTQ